eukprot:456916_1
MFLERQKRRRSPMEETLVSLGFQKNYIGRAFKVYEKNYGFSYNIEVMTEIIVRLQNKDKLKAKTQKRNAADKESQPSLSPNKSLNKQKDSNNKNKIPQQPKTEAS